MKVAIIGLGLIGGSLAQALRQNRPQWEVIGVENNPVTQQLAAAEGLSVVDSIARAVAATPEVMVIATPIQVIPQVLEQLSGYPGVITDVASTKSQVMAWAQEVGVDLVGGHPMAGREKGGWEMAQPNLFKDAPWILAREEPKVLEVIQAAGAIPVVLEPQLHDQVIAGVSHAGFFLAACYLLALAEHSQSSQMAELTGPGFEGMTRLMKGDPALPIAMGQTNSSAIIQILERVQSQLEVIISTLQTKGSVEDFFRKAHEVAERFAREKAKFIAVKQEGVSGADAS